MTENPLIAAVYCCKITARVQKSPWTVQEDVSSLELLISLSDYAELIGSYCENAQMATCNMQNKSVAIVKVKQESWFWLD